MNWKKNDSLSECSSHRELYDLRSTPKASGSQSFQESPEETPESRFFLKLSKTSIWKMLGVLLKYVLMALILPPYVVFYGIPKWVIQKGWPPVRHLAGCLSQQGCHLFKKMSQFIQKLIPTKAGMRRVFQLEKIQGWLKALRSKIQQIYSSCTQRASSACASCISPIKRIASAASEKVLKSKETLISTLQAWSSSLVRAPKAGFALVSTKLKKAAQAAQSVLVKCWSTSKNSMRTIGQKISQGLTSMRGTVFRLGGNVVVQLKALSSKVGSIGTRLKSSIRSCSGAIAVKSASIMEMTKNQACKLKSLKSSLYRPFAMLSKAMSTQWNTVQGWGTKIKAGLDLAFAKMKDLTKYAKVPNMSALRSKGQKILQGQQDILVKGKQKILSVVHSLKRAPKKFLQQLATVSQKYLHKTAYGARVALALIRILPQYIFKIASDLMAEIKQWLPFKP